MFTTEPELYVQERPDIWELAAPLQWVSPQLEMRIPAGFLTDLASIPKVLRNVLDVNGCSRAPAILHDALYNCLETSRAFADGMLQYALIAYGAGPATAWAYWAGVRIGGWHPWDERAAIGKGMHRGDFADDLHYQEYLAGGPLVKQWNPALL